MGERSDSMELSGFKSPMAVSRQPLSPISFRQVYAFEVWNADGRVFPEPPLRPTKVEELDRRSVSLSANAKALREAADAARDRSAILREMARTTRYAADEFRKQADAARKRQEAR